MSTEENAGSNLQGEKEDKTESKQSSRERFYVIALLIYYMLLLFFSFWLLFDIWSYKFTFMQAIGVSEEALKEPLLRTIGFTIVGGFLGSVLYNIRILHFWYAQMRVFDPRWLGKYITGPWEGAGLAMVVLALIRGGVALFGGSMGTDVTAASNFSAFGIGAMVGFGTRDVIGWINQLVHTMFTMQKPETK